MLFHSHAQKWMLPVVHFWLVGNSPLMHSNVGQMGPFIWMQGLVCRVMFAHRLQVKSQQMHEKLMNDIMEAATNRPEMERFAGILHSHKI